MREVIRFCFKLILCLLLALGAFAYGAVPLVDRLTLQWFIRDLDIRASLVANTVHGPLQDLLRPGSRERMLQFFMRITQDERLFAIAEVRDLTPARDDEGAVVALPELERMLVQALEAIRGFQARRPLRSRLMWNRVVLHAWPVIELVTVSVARTVWLPDATRVTPFVKVCVPLSPPTNV